MGFHVGFLSIDELDNITPLIPLFTRLETLHFFPASDLLPTSSSSSLRPSFFQSTFPRILSHLADPNAGSAYGSIWQVLLDELSRGTARTIGVSFFSTLTSRIRTSSSTGTVGTREVDIDHPPDGQIKRASSVIFDLLGPPSTSPSSTHLHPPPFHLVQAREPSLPISYPRKGMGGHERQSEGVCSVRRDGRERVRRVGFRRGDESLGGWGGSQVGFDGEGGM